MRISVKAFLLIGIPLCLPKPTEAQMAADANQWENFDARLLQPAAQAVDSGARQRAITDIKAHIPSIAIDFDELLGSPSFIRALDSPLTDFDEDPDLWPPLPPNLPQDFSLPPKPDWSDRNRALKRFLDENSSLFGFNSTVLASAQIQKEYSAKGSPLRTVVWQQQHDGIPVFEAMLIANFQGSTLASLSSHVLPNPDSATIANTVTIDASEAVALAARNIGETDASASDFVPTSEPQGTNRNQTFQGDPVLGEAQASLVWLPMNSTTIRSCWRVVLTGRQTGMLFQVLIDADTAGLQVRHCWTDNAVQATYLIFNKGTPTPPISGWSTPSSAQRTMIAQTNITLTAISTNASPDGWVTTNSNSFGLIDTTFGNNVDAFLYWTIGTRTYGQANTPARPAGVLNGSTIEFTGASFTEDPSQSPTTSANSSAAVVNTFYWCNWMHDVLYELGFTEAAGNYQYDNFGRGGSGGDAVLMEVQDAATINWGGTSSTMPTDGNLGRIVIGIWGDSSAPYDADFDATIFLHEYTHLMSKRLVGGGTGISQPQSLGLNEAWSDFYALSLLSDPTSNLDAPYVVAGFSMYHFEGTTFNPEFDKNYYFGIRPYPCSTDMTKSPQTLRDLYDAGQTNPHQGVDFSPVYSSGGVYTMSANHAFGEIWCVALWDARVNLIRNLGTNGNWLMLQLTTDGESLCGANPNFLQARDGVLKADMVRTGGQNQLELWTAFAKRGMGYSATNAPSSVALSGQTTGVQESFSIPPLVTNLSTILYSSPAFAADGTIYIGGTNSLYAVTATGSQKWAFGGLTTNYSFNSSPAIGPGGVIYVGCNDSNLYAVASSGAMIWSTNLGGQVFSSPAIGNDGTIYVGSDNGSVFAVNPSGTLKWTNATGGAINSSPAIGLDGTVYVGSMNSNLYAFNPTNGNVLSGWPVTLSSNVYSSPALGSDGSIYVGCLDGKVYGFTTNGNAKSGWPATTGGAVYSSPAVSSNGTVFIGSSDGKLYSINANGTTNWTYQTGSNVLSSPALGRNGNIFFGSYDGHFYVLDATGSNLWTYPISTPIFSSPVIGMDDRIYFGSLEGNLYVLPARTPFGDAPWSMFRQNFEHTAAAKTLILRSGQVNTNGNFVFDITGPAGATCSVDVSTNLPSWSSLTNVTLVNGVGTVQTSSTNSPQQFFRARF